MKVEGVRKAWDKYKFVALVALAGAVLLLWPEGGSSSASAESGFSLPDPAEQARQLEKEMEDILSKVSGVGQVQVLLTAESDGQRLLAADTEESRQGAGDISRSSETVVVDGSGGEAPVVTQTWYPTYRGALVVCQGGDQAAVRLAVTQAVMALTGLSADRVTVAKWQ